MLITNFFGTIIDIQIPLTRGEKKIFTILHHFLVLWMFVLVNVFQVWQAPMNKLQGF
jgi:hypothetical protein